MKRKNKIKNENEINMEYSKSREIKGKRYYRRGREKEKEENERGSKIEKYKREMGRKMS
jgi:hypothetical protein